MSEGKVKKLTWKEVADIYDETKSGRPARTLPLEDVYEWAKKQTDKFIIHEDGTLSLK